MLTDAERETRRFGLRAAFPLLLSLSHRCLLGRRAPTPGSARTPSRRPPPSLSPVAFPPRHSLPPIPISPFLSSHPLDGRGATMPATPIPRRGPQNAFTRRVSKILNFDLLSAFASSHKNPYPRQVLINAPIPPEAEATAPKFSIPGWTRKVKNDEGKVIRTEKRGFGSKPVPAPGWTFDSNQVLTSKYNVFTFIPRNLLEQFRRVANIFFLSQSLLVFPLSRLLAPLGLVAE